MPTLYQKEHRRQIKRRALIKKEPVLCPPEELHVRLMVSHMLNEEKRLHTCVLCLVIQTLLMLSQVNILESTLPKSNWAQE